MDGTNYHYQYALFITRVNKIITLLFILILLHYNSKYFMIYFKTKNDT